MASTRFAPSSTPAQTLIGPVLTASGFQCWYLLCSPDCIIAVRVGFLEGLLLAVAPTNAPLIGANLAVILFGWLQGRAGRKRSQLEAKISRSTASSLRSAPNQIYPIGRLRSITLKGGMVPITIPEIVLETMDGSRKKFGLYHFEFAQASVQLQQMYPHLCQPK